MAQASDTRSQQGSNQPKAANNPGQQGQQQRGMARRGDDYLPALWAAQSPFALMRRFSDEMDRLFGGGLFSEFGPSRRGLTSRGERRAGFPPAQWMPATEVFQRDDQFVVRADLPGINKDDLNVELTNNVLTIAGERREERQDTRGHSERVYGRFFRKIPLPEGVNAQNVKATFQNGVLEITMPAPQPEQQDRRIEIQAGSGDGAQTLEAQPSGTQSSQTQPPGEPPKTKP